MWLREDLSQQTAQSSRMRSVHLTVAVVPRHRARLGAGRRQRQVGTAITALAVLCSREVCAAQESANAKWYVSVTAPVAEFEVLTLDAKNGILGSQTQGVASLGVREMPRIGGGYSVLPWLDIGVVATGGICGAKSDLSSRLDRGSEFVVVALGTVKPWVYAWGYPKLALGFGYYHHNGAWIDGDVRANAVAMDGEVGVNVWIIPQVGFESSATWTSAIGSGTLSFNGGIPVNVSKHWLGWSAGINVHF
jgi:hypothetical protein